MELAIDKEYEGYLVREYLRRVLGLSRASLTALKGREDGIVLNGGRVSVRAVLHEGDRLDLGIEDRFCDAHPHLTPCPLPLDILYEDEHLICVNKPADMPTHPTHGHYTDTLANALAYEFQNRGLPFVFRAVNRLDRDTSGAVLIAKDQVSAEYLGAQMRDRTIDKRYIAVCRGRTPAHGRIENRIRRTGQSVITREICPPGEPGEHAVTEYKTLFQNDRMSVVEARPLTGRTHQLRVHFSGIGHPIFGDTLYGEACLQIARQALHAHTVTFRTPFSGEQITVRAPLPEDITTLIEELR